MAVLFLFFYRFPSCRPPREFKEREGGGGEMATGDILIFNYSNYVMIYYQKQRGRDVGVDGEVEFIINRYVEIKK